MQTTHPKCFHSGAPGWKEFPMPPMGWAIKHFSCFLPSSACLQSLFVQCLGGTIACLTVGFISAASALQLVWYIIKDLQNHNIATCPVLPLYIKYTHQCGACINPIAT
eukprot:TRINITY_DN62692_c2_g1_i1.p3 TRINITY_DN62692_c2_g1~~TRINITY_DN62692_c2_g1_i1.p3  ORF type:complete len:108 (-),score=10.62 TRINITY_DN62692_c2_g1_i1:324-647(-)